MPVTIPTMPQPKNQHQASSSRILVVMTRPTTDRTADDVIAVVQRRHRVLVAVVLDEERHRCHADDRREDAERAQHQREDDPLDPAGDGVNRDAEDHRADVLGGHGFEQVGATAGAVTDVVADQVGDDGRVARVVFRNTGLDLADEVGADVSGLGVDTTAELGEQGHEAGAEAEADDEERSDRRRVAEDIAVDSENGGNADEAQSHDEETRDGAAASATVIASLRLFWLRQPCGRCCAPRCTCQCSRPVRSRSPRPGTRHRSSGLH